jgi:HEAT repeat protein
MNLWPAILARLAAPQRNSVAKLFDGSNPPDFYQYAAASFPPTGNFTPDGLVLLRNSVLAWAVVIPDGLSREQALELARMAQAVDPLDVQLMQILGECAEKPSEVNDAMIMRGLDLIENLGPKPRLVMPLIKFTKHPNVRVRSKAAKIAGRITSNQTWIRQHFMELDPRVRSNLLEAIVQNPEFDGIKGNDLLRHAVDDPHHRVSVTALFLLAKMGDQPSLERIKALQKDDNPAMKKAADWAISQLQTPASQEKQEPVNSAG